MPEILQPTSPSFVDVALVVAVVLTVIGAVLHIYQPQHRVSVEEQVKGRVMSAREGRWHLRLYRCGTPVISVLGVLLLLLSCNELVR